MDWMSRERQLEKVQLMLLNSGKNTAGIVQSRDFADFRTAFKHRCGTKGCRNFLEVVEEHPEWIYKIIDHAVKLVELSESSQNSDERQAADPYVAVAYICTSIQETAQALSNLNVQRWDPCPDVGQLQDDPARRNSLIQAICQGVGAWTPSGALTVGLNMALFSMGVKAELDAPTGSIALSIEEGGLSEASKQELAMVETLSKMHRTAEVDAGAKVAGTGADLKLKFTANPRFMGAVEKTGLKILKDIFEKKGNDLESMTKSKRAGPPDRNKVMDNRHFMSANTGMCAVWSKESCTVEIYQHMQLTDHHGVLELLCTFSDVSNLPIWDATLVQEFTIRDSTLSSLSQDCKGYELSKKTSGKDVYEPIRLCCEGAEKYVEEALVSSNLKGGCWNTIMHGRPPSSNPNLEKGFRTAPLCVAAAGMAIWFPSNYRKMAAWIHFPNVLLCDERSLTLGTCDVNARIGGRSGKEDEQVAFLAWKDSKIWETKVMFG